MKKSLKNLIFAGTLLAFSSGSFAYAKDAKDTPDKQSSTYEVPRGANKVVHKRKEADKKEANKEVPKKEEKQKKEKKEGKRYSDITVTAGTNFIDNLISYHGSYTDNLKVKGNEFYCGLNFDKIVLPNDLKLNLGINYLGGKESTSRDGKEIGDSEKRKIDLSAIINTDWKFKGAKITPAIGIADKRIENEGNYGSLKTKANNEYSGMAGQLDAEFEFGAKKSVPAIAKSTSTAPTVAKSTSTASVATSTSTVSAVVPKIILSVSGYKLNSKTDKDISSLNSRGFSFGLIYPNKNNVRAIISSLDKSIDGNNASKYKAFINDELSNETALSVGYRHLEARVAQYNGDVKGNKVSAVYSRKKFAIEAGVDTKKYTQHFSNSDKDTTKRKVYISLQKRF